MKAARPGDGHATDALGRDQDRLSGGPGHADVNRAGGRVCTASDDDLVARNSAVNCRLQCGNG